MSDLPERPPFNELEKYALYTPTPGVENRRAKLAWVVRDGNPRISVSTNNPSDTVKAPISAAMNPETFFAFLNEFEKIIDGPNDNKGKVTCFTGEWVNGASTGNRVLNSELYYGKDKDGKIWICVKAEHRPEIQFYFGVSIYHVFYRAGGPISDAEASQIQAKAVVQSIRNIFYNLTAGFRKPGNKANFTPVKQESSKDTFADLEF